MSNENPVSFSRRAFLASTGLMASAALLAPRRLFAQGQSESARVGLVDQFRTEAAHARIDVQKLRGNISVLTGSGGNIAVLHGKDGKLLVDAGLAGSRPQIAEALESISSEPVRHLVNTHWHFDHTDGNQWLHEAGAAIIAHENVRKRMSEPTRVEPWDFTFPPSSAAALPTMTLRAPTAKDSAAGATLHINGLHVRIDTYQPAHTDGDTVVEFHDADVIHLGDLWWNGHYPFIDYDTGGNIDGMIRAAESNLARVDQKTVIIPGHGPVGGKSQLTEYRDMLVAIHDRVTVLKKQGKSVDEIITAKPTAAFDARWGTFLLDGPTFTRLVYAGV